MSDGKESDIKGKCITAAKHTTSEMLFVGARELLIEHAGDIYRLRLTNLGKLQPIQTETSFFLELIPV